MEIEHSDLGEEWLDKFHSIPKHKTKILPLRWFGNVCNVYPASWAIKMALHYENKVMETNLPLPKAGHRWWKLYRIFDAPYRKWGTSYELTDWKI